MDNSNQQSSAETSQTQQYWENVFREWGKSNLKQLEFCSLHKIKYSTFMYWRTNLKRLSGIPLKSNKSKFIPIKLSAPLLNPPIAARCMDIIFSSGIKVSLPIDLPKEKLKEILSLLGITV